LNFNLDKKYLAVIAAVRYFFIHSRTKFIIPLGSSALYTSWLKGFVKLSLSLEIFCYTAVPLLLLKLETIHAKACALFSVRHSGPG
jgi:hypothetical protein